MTNVQSKPNLSADLSAEALAEVEALAKADDLMTKQPYDLKGCTFSRLCEERQRRSNPSLHI